MQMRYRRCSIYFVAVYLSVGEGKYKSEIAPVFGDLLLLGVVPLPLLRLDPRQFLGRQGLEVCRVLRVRRAAGGTVARTFRSDLVPTEATDL